MAGSESEALVVGPEMQARREGKAALMQAVTRLNSTLVPSPGDLQALMDAVKSLCELNPTPDSATSPLLDGRWVLLYTASSAPGGAVVGGGGKGKGSGQSGDGGGGGGGGLASALPFLQAISDSAYQFFYRFVPVLAGSAVGVRGSSSSMLGVKPRGNFQEFDTIKGIVLNQARFEAFGTDCEINVGGTITPALTSSPSSSSPTSPSSPSSSSPSLYLSPRASLGSSSGTLPRSRVRATFTSGNVIIGDRFRLDIPIGVLSPVGYVDTPYLDEELRISIGDKGSIFIARKE